ncbi:unnamed protein product, partial [Nesidiocoris tenuis]
MIATRRRLLLRVRLPGPDRSHAQFPSARLSDSRVCSARSLSLVRIRPVNRANVSWEPALLNILLTENY